MKPKVIFLHMIGDIKSITQVNYEVFFFTFSNTFFIKTIENQYALKNTPQKFSNFLK